MSIRIYPSRLPGEPLETHVVAGPVQLDRWLSDIAGQEISTRPTQPVVIEVNGQPISDFTVTIQPEDDVRVYPVPYGTGAEIAAWAALAVAVVSTVYMLSLDMSAPEAPGQGDKIDTNAAKANSVKLHQPVRELLGRYRIYPDYVVQPVSRFVNERDMETSMCLCVGVGEYDIPESGMKIGDTPFAAFGTDVSYTHYAPGQSLVGDIRAENWYVVGEVGGTDGGTAGLDMNATAPVGEGASADAVTIGGQSVAISGDDPAFAPSWGVGTIIELRTPDTYIVSNVGGYDRIAGPLSDLAPFVGMKITLSGDDDHALVVASYSPYVAPVPGVGGYPSSVQASGAPITYDFSATTATWSITYQGVTRTLSLTADYITMSGLVDAINSQLAGMGLVAQDNSGRVRIVEPSSPYQGGVISQTGAPESVFGISPTYTTGLASDGGTPGQLAYITCTYDDGTPFAGLMAGSNRLALGYRGNQYRITGISGLTMTVSRLTDVGEVDTGWAGWTSRTLVDFELSSGVDDESWLGPFMGCPEGETTSTLEYDIYMPQGLATYSKKGRLRGGYVTFVLEWRDAAVLGEWTPVETTIIRATEDSLGFTYSLALPYAMRPQVRMRRIGAPGGGQVRDALQWYGLRAKLAAPTSYSGVSLFALTVRTGSRLGAQSDRKVNLIATRKHGGVADRSIKSAALYVLDSLGISRDRVDESQIAILDSTYWAPRGETYDMAHTEQQTMRDVLKTIFGAGMGHLVLSGGLISAIREGVQSPKGTITPHEMTGPLNVGFVAPSSDDYDGVDVEYISAATWAKETVQCRLTGSIGRKVEKISLDGVTDRTRAWRIGMRQLRKRTGQRLSFDASTEMDALCYEYMDHLVLVDDLPGTTQTALIVGAEWGADGVTLEVSEAFDWSVASPRVMIRRHDGTVTALAVPVYVSPYELRVPLSAIDFDLITDLSIEPARIIFAGSTQIGYAALVSEISPGSDGACSITAVEYSDSYYADDDNAPA